MMPLCFWTKRNGTAAFTCLEDGTYLATTGLARPLREGEWHALRFEVRGDRASLFLDEQLALQADMEGVAASGGIFIGSVNCDVSFDDITVEQF